MQDWPCAPNCRCLRALVPSPASGGEAEEVGGEVAQATERELPLELEEVAAFRAGIRPTTPASGLAHACSLYDSLGNANLPLSESRVRPAGGPGQIGLLG